MKLHDLRANEGARKKRTRVGRGISAGQGKTAGRGTKGQSARPNGTKAPYFEGGQLPLVRRLPFKRGFNNIFRIEHQEVNLSQISKLFKKGDEITPETLAAKHLIDSATKPVVILGNGDKAIGVAISAHRITKGALDKLEKAGGSFRKLELSVKGARATVKLLPKAQRSK